MQKTQSIRRMQNCKEFRTANERKIAKIAEDARNAKTKKIAKNAEKAKHEKM